MAYSPGFTDGLLGSVFGGPGKTSIRAAFGMYYTSVEDLNLFYEVADAPFGLYWQSPASVQFDQPFLIRQTGQSLGQRFPYTLPIPGAPSNKTLDFGQFEPINYFPGYYIHNRLPYAEHFNLSIQRELTKSTVLTLAYVGTEGHRLITQDESNPGDPTLCQQLTAQGAIDTTAGTPGCGFGAENDVFQLPTATSCTASPTPLPGCVYGTSQQGTSRNKLSNQITARVRLSRCVMAMAIPTHLRTPIPSTTPGKSPSNARPTISASWSPTLLPRLWTIPPRSVTVVNFVNPRLSRGLSSTDITHNFVASYVWAIPFDRPSPTRPSV